MSKKRKAKKPKPCPPAKATSPPRPIRSIKKKPPARERGGDQAREASIVAVLGVTGCGKSSWLKQQLEHDPRRRLLIWDFKREYMGLRASSCAELVAILQRMKGTFCITFAPSMDAKIRAREFDLFCRLAMQVRDLTVIVEELKFVTEPSRAPAPWSMLTMTGRDLGVHVIATSQRPASIDKDFLGNATLIHTGRLVYPEDVQATAKAMGIAPDYILHLADLEYVEADKRSGRSRTGTVQIA